MLGKSVFRFQLKKENQDVKNAKKKDKKATKAAEPAEEKKSQTPEKVRPLHSSQKTQSILFTFVSTSNPSNQPGTKMNLRRPESSSWRVADRS